MTYEHVVCIFTQRCQNKNKKATPPPPPSPSRKFQRHLIMLQRHFATRTLCGEKIRHIFIHARIFLLEKLPSTCHLKPVGDRSRMKKATFNSMKTANSIRTFFAHICNLHSFRQTHTYTHMHPVYRQFLARVHSVKSAAECWSGAAVLVYWFATESPYQTAANSLTLNAFNKRPFAFWPFGRCSRF